MAISFIAERANATSTSGGSAWTGLSMAAGASITPGNTLILQLAYHEAATGTTGNVDQGATPTQNMSIAIDLRGNLWRRIAVSANAGSSSAADNGAVVAIWMCHVTNPYENNDIITIRTFVNSRPLTAVAGVISEFSRVRRVSRSLSGTAATGNSTTAAAPAVSPTASGQLVIGAAAIWGNPTVTGDSDTTDGSWSAISSSTSGASGIRRVFQYKVVTGTSAQNWSATWTGTAQWAAVGVVLEEALVTWPGAVARMANPGFPCPTGPEILPVSAGIVPIDTGTGYINEVDLPYLSAGSESIAWFSNLQLPTETRGSDSQHHLVCEVYPRGQELIRDESFSISLGTPWQVTTGASTTVVDATGTPSGGSAANALASVGGDAVLMEAPHSTGSVELRWDPTSLAQFVGSHRVLDMQLRYIAWKDDSAISEAGEGISVRWRDTRATGDTSFSGITTMYGAYLVNDYQVGSHWVSRNMGEVNGGPRLGVFNGFQWRAASACFTIDDLLRMANGVEETSWVLQVLPGSDASQDGVFLDTIELIVTLAPERRVAHAARRVASGYGFPDVDEVGTGPMFLNMYDAYDTSQFWAPSAATPELSVVLREGLPCSPSDWFAAQTDPTNVITVLGSPYRYASQERVGPSFGVPAILQPRDTMSPQSTLKRAEWVDGRIGGEPESFGNHILRWSLVDMNSRQGFSASYDINNVLQEGPDISNNIEQSFENSGDATFDAIKVFVRPPLVDGSPDLTITIERPLNTVLATATLTQADALAAPDVGGGYREIILPLDTPVSPIASSLSYMVASSPTTAPNNWIIGAAKDENTFGKLNFNPIGYLADQTGETTDWAMTLLCPINDLDVSIETSVVGSPGNGTACVATSTTIPCVTIENATDYDWISVERVVDGVDSTPVGLVDVAASTEFPSLLYSDSFDRTEPSDWGTPNLGPAWTFAPDGGATSEVANGVGVIDAVTAPSDSNQTLPAPMLPFEVSATVSIPEAPSGGAMAAYVFTDDGTDTGYSVGPIWNATGSVVFTCARFVSGSGTSWGTSTEPTTFPAGTRVRIKLYVHEGGAKAKMWRVDDVPEPDWQFFDDTVLTPPTVVGLGGERGSGNTSSDTSLYYDDFQVLAYEAQEVSFCDYAVPWDLPAGSIEYVIKGYRDSDRRTVETSVVWNDTSAASGAAFGLASNDGLFAYLPVSDSGPLEVAWNPMNPTEALQLAGKDYQVALRPAENRGVSVTVNLAVDKLAVCAAEPTPPESGEDGADLTPPLGAYDDVAGYSYSEAVGGKSMGVRPFDRLRRLSRTQRVTLKLPGGHTRFVYVTIGAMTRIPSVGLANAEVTLTDATEPDVTPPGWME